MAEPLPTPTAPGPLLPWLLAALSPMNRTKVKQLLKHGCVAVNGKATTQHDHPLRPGDRVTLERGGPVAKPAKELAIVYEDDAVVVIDKPVGLLSVANETEKDDTAFTRLTARGPARPLVVHRIDRDTSGLLLFAKSVPVRDRLQADWDRVEKIYLAVVEGKPDPDAGTIDNYLTEGRDLRVRRVPPGPNAKRAVSHYKTIRTRGPHSLVEVRLETGRKHQIRVHLAGLGCPITGDGMYRAKTDLADRLALHAWRLAFDHPLTGARIELESPMPKALKWVLDGGVR